MGHVKEDSKEVPGHLEKVKAVVYQLTLVDNGNKKKKVIFQIL